jgi:hypothetical protein
MYVLCLDLNLLLKCDKHCIVKANKLNFTWKLSQVSPSYPVFAEW